MRWDIPNNGSNEASVDEDGSSLWGSDSEGSEADSIGHSLTGAQRSCELVVRLELLAHVPATYTPASGSSLFSPMDISLQLVLAKSKYCHFLLQGHA